MPYIGSSASPLPVNFAAVQAQSFNGTGSQTAFTLSRTVSSAASIEVLVNNVQQSPYDDSYSVSGTTLTFSEAPSSGTNNVYVVYRDQSLGSLVDESAYRKAEAVAKAGDTMTGALVLDGQTSQFPNALSIVPSTHSTSRRSGILMDDWTICQDTLGNGVKDFGFYSGAVGGSPLKIDTAGRVTMPFQPSFEAYNNSGLQLNTDNTQYDFNAVVHNIGGHFNIATNKFTAPVAGRYLIAFRTLANNTAGSFANIQVRINDVNTYYAGHNHVDKWIMEGFTGVVQLAANDTVDIFVVARSAHYGRNYASFSGHLIG